MTSERATTTTFLFSDIVGSTELMQRDEDAQRIFKAHYQPAGPLTGMEEGLRQAFKRRAEFLGAKP
jgi:hypothetical protein